MGNRHTVLPRIPPPPPPQQPLPAEEEEDRNQEFTCEICMVEPMSISGKKIFRNANKCSHRFCTDCIIKYISVKLDENVGIIKCPALNCNYVLDPVACAAAIGPRLFIRWCDLLCEVAVVHLDKCYCPYRNCNVLIVNECGGNVRKSNCPKCKRWFCFECKRDWHAGFGCRDSLLYRDSNDIAFGRLAEQMNWKRCPQCRHFVERVAGCQIMTCRCGIYFCYKCGEKTHGHQCRRCGRI